MSRKLFLLIIAFSLSVIISCNKENNPDAANLSPARKLVGTWKTTIPVKFFIKTDFCSGALELVASEKREVTFIITEVTGNENEVNIECRYSSTDFIVLNQNCTNGTGYVPDVSPTFLKGEISSSQLNVKNYSGKLVCSISFTTDLMEGTWDDSWCAVYCQEVYTDAKALKLKLQN